MPIKLCFPLSWKILGDNLKKTLRLLYEYGLELKGTCAEVMQGQKLEKIINGLTESQQDLYQIIKEHHLDFITPTELSKKVEFAEKEKTYLDLCRRTLEQLVKKR